MSLKVMLVEITETRVLPIGDIHPHRWGYNLPVGIKD